MHVDQITQVPAASHSILQDMQELIVLHIEAAVSPAPRSRPPNSPRLLPPKSNRLQCWSIEHFEDGGVEVVVCRAKGNGAGRVKFLADVLQDLM